MSIDTFVNAVEYVKKGVPLLLAAYCGNKYRVYPEKKADLGENLSTQFVSLHRFFYSETV
ncbi:MAG: hypothetical protein JRI53_10215 [Deltaproteobacteria bacterium]|nr:hypothetical protein [Deltaproteobacteria bacterium]